MLPALWIKPALYLIATLAFAWVLHAGYSAIWQRGWNTRDTDATLQALNAEAELARQREQFEREAREAEQRQRDALAGVAADYEQEKANAQTIADRTIAALRAGTVRLRDEWAGCETDALVSGAAVGAGVADDRARLREQGAGDLVLIGEQCDAQVRGLQAAGRVTAPAR